VEGNRSEERLLELQAFICQALGDPKRLRILYAVADKERSVGDLAEELGVSLTNVSQHLGVLRARGLVRARREGNVVRYSLAYPQVMEACRALRAVLAKQLAEDGKLASLLKQAS
jgi:ArsR family transcriptional regulator